MECSFQSIGILEPLRARRRLQERKLTLLSPCCFLDLNYPIINSMGEKVRYNVGPLFFLQGGQIAAKRLASHLLLQCHCLDLSNNALWLFGSKIEDIERSDHRFPMSHLILPTLSLYWLPTTWTFAVVKSGPASFVISDVWYAFDRSRTGRLTPSIRRLCLIYYFLLR